MNHKRFPFICLMILFTFMLSSCGSGSPTSEAPSAGAITLVDALEREVTFESPPQRIVIAGRATTMVVNALYMFPEASQRLVSFENRTQRDTSFYSLVDDDFDEMELLERNAGAEQIAPFQPDVVLMKSYMADSLGVSLEQIDIPVIYVDLETPEQFDRDIAIMGKLLGNEARAQQIIDFYGSGLQALDQMLAGVVEDDKPQVLLMQYSDRGGEVAFQVPSTDWLQTALVERAGGNPVWTEAAESGGWTVVGFEQVAAWNPDQIFVIYYPDDPGPIVELLMDDPNWQALDAVQQEEIYGFVGDFWSWDQPDPRWILGFTWLSTQIQPDVTMDIDLTQKITTFYQQMYGLELDVIEAQILPLIRPALDR